MFTEEELEVLNTLSALLEGTGYSSFQEEDRNTVRHMIAIYELSRRGKADVLERDYQLPVIPDLPELNKELLKSISKKLKSGPKNTPARKLYISDMHFFHSSLNTKMDCRGFKDHEEMNAYMIEQWNSVVRKKDEVYILGDLSIAKGKATNEVLRQLRGKLYLIEGNHDSRFLSDKEFDRSRFVWIRPYAEISDRKRHVILSHYPVFCYNGQYKKQDGEPCTYMLYGHVHNSHDETLVDSFIRQTRETKVMSKHSTEPEPIPCNMINCFCMFSDYKPLSLDEWIETDRLRRQKKEQTDE